LNAVPLPIQRAVDPSSSASPAAGAPARPRTERCPPGQCTIGDNLIQTFPDGPDHYRAEPDPQVRLRAHIVLLLADGYPWATVAAVRCLDQAAQKRPKEAICYLPLHPHDTLVCHLLLREAEARLKGSRP
jgi:hypothetical protein